MRVALTYHVSATSQDIPVDDYIDDYGVMVADCSISGEAKLVNDRDETVHLREGVQQLQLDDWRGLNFQIRQINANESTVHLYSEDGDV